MSDVGDFIERESIHEKELAEFMQWQFVENQKKGSTLCRDDNYRPIILKKELPIGEFYDVKITDSEYGFMTAVLV